MKYHLESKNLAFPDCSWKLVETFTTRKAAESAKRKLASFANAYRILEELGDLSTPAIDMRTPEMKLVHNLAVIAKHKAKVKEDYARGVINLATKRNTLLRINEIAKGIK